MAQVIDARTGEITSTAPDEAFTILDPYSEEGVVIAQPRPDWLATVSAGRLVASDKGGLPYPSASADGTIYISDPDNRAPKLAELLTASGGKKLTIVFPSDDLEAFIHQRFTRRTATALEVYGDQYSLTEIHNTSRQVPGRDGKTREVVDSVHTTHPVGSQEYRDLKRTCKAETSVLFTCGEWLISPTGTRAEISFPDGYGWYRIRFTSRHSLHAIVDKLMDIKANVTSGRIAGLPFELSIQYREVAGPDGHKRKIPVWALLFRPPETIHLTSGNLGGLLRGALAEGERLRLAPEPAAETLEMALLDAPDIDLDDSAVQVLTSQEVRCDARYWEGVFFATVKGTRFASEVDRAWLLDEYTRAQTESLAYFLEHATEAEASAFIAHVSDLLDAERKAEAPTRVPGQRGGESALELQRRLMGDGEEPPPAPIAPTTPDGTLEQWLAKYQTGMRLVRERGLDEARWELPSDAGLEDVRAAVLSISAAIKGELAAAS